MRANFSSTLFGSLYRWNRSFVCPRKPVMIPILTMLCPPEEALCRPGDMGFRKPVFLEKLPVVSALGEGVLEAQVVEGNHLVLDAEVGKFVAQAVSLLVVLGDNQRPRLVEGL